jgi:hypothetical protein
MTQPIAAMENLVSNATQGYLQEPWNPDLVAFVGQEIYEGMNCMQAWKVIPVNSVVAALDAVRNRILSFVLEIEAESPDAGEAPLNSNPLPQEKVHQIFNTYISGNVQNVATGSSQFRQKASNTHTNEKLFQDLLDSLRNSGADSVSVDELSGAIEEMRAQYGTEGFRATYEKFMAGLADHMQVLGPVVAPYLPALTSLLP